MIVPITMQVWNKDLDKACEKGAVWLFGKNNCDNTRWIEEAINCAGHWIFTSTMKEIPKEVTPIAWSNKVYPELSKEQKNDDK